MVPLNLTSAAKGDNERRAGLPRSEKIKKDKFGQKQFQNRSN